MKSIPNHATDASTSTPIPSGVWPVMITPFQEDGSIDWKSLDTLINWYIDAGVSGLFAVCLSSEMYHLTDVERVQLAAHVVKQAQGRVPVVATGTFGGTIKAQADMVNQISATGVTGVVVIANRMADEKESDCDFIKRAETLLSATGDIPLGLYECPVPYKRLLTPELLKWAASTGRFVFHKDTCCSISAIEAKLSAISGTPFRWFNANTPTLLDSLNFGGNGYSGIAANLMPHLYVWLCKNYERNPELAKKLQQFLSISDAVIRYKYPVSAKQFLVSSRVIASAKCRIDVPSLVEEDSIILSDLERSIADWLHVM
jgi:4-hydroxy-tetrahydrodipicolinate synthase